MMKIKNSPTHFKDEIRTSFIFYALVPAFIFVCVFFLGAIFAWNWRLYRHTADENIKISNEVSKIVVCYSNYCKGFSQNYLDSSVNDFSNLYSELKNFTMNQSGEADFLVLDKDFNLLLNGNNMRSFTVPEWQKENPWGILSRIKSNLEKTYVEISADFNKEGKPEIVIAKSFVKDNELYGFLVFILSERIFSSVLEPTISFVITDSFGHFFLASDSRYQNQFNKIKDEYRRNKSYYLTQNEAVCHRTTAENLLEVFTFSDISIMKITVSLLCFMTFSFLCVLIFGMFLSAEKIAEEKSKTINQIVDACEDVSAGNVTRRISVKSNIEFEKIASSFNNMLANVENLIEENKKETQERCTAELKQLEMQFNPHFLFNTLETIKFLIKLDPEKAQKTILSLSELLRYSINNEISVVPISEDIHYIENYLYILKLRFGERFNYLIDIPENTKSCLIPKLVLQPIIGNSVKYGFEESETMNLTINVRSVSGRLIINVKDDGSGMDKDRLKFVRSLIKAEQNETRHIGLFNAQKRLRIMYGKPYGIKIDSTKENGTTVKLVMPVRTFNKA